MGGYGSTRWNRHNKKATVDNALTISITKTNHFHGLKSNHTHRGKIVWTWSSWGKESSADIGYEYQTEDDFGFMKVWYTVGSSTDNPRDYEYLIPLVTTRPHYGGLRWWFICPLIVGGVPCKRRVGTLHSNSRCDFFGCRHCLNLTYKSSQDSDKRIRALVNNLDVDQIEAMIESGNFSKSLLAFRAIMEISRKFEKLI